MLQEKGEREEEEDRGRSRRIRVERRGIPVKSMRMGPLVLSVRTGEGGSIHVDRDRCVFSEHKKLAGNLYA